MQRFEAAEAEEAARRKALLEGEADEDGFITVTYKEKRGRSDAPPPVAKADDTSGGLKKKRKGAGSLPDFYRFQVCRSPPYFGLELLPTSFHSPVFMFA